MTQNLLRLQAVKSKRGVSRSTHYAHISQGLWTKPVKLSARAVGWPECEVTALNAARIAGMSDDEIKILVARLEAARKVPA